MPLKLSIKNTIKNGTVKDKGKKRRPTMVETACWSTPTKSVIAVIGIPSAPKATGAVLAIKHKPAAYKGLRPKPTNKAAVIATGSPKPIAPSKNEPKQKPIKST